MKNFKPGILILFLMPFLLISCDMINDLLNTGKVPDDIMGMENVGCGYDVFDKYADVLSIKAAILDADLMNAAGILDFKKIEKAVWNVEGCFMQHPMRLFYTDFLLLGEIVRSIRDLRTAG